MVHSDGACAPSFLCGWVPLSLVLADCVVLSEGVTNILCIGPTTQMCVWTIGTMRSVVTSLVCLPVHATTIKVTASLTLVVAFTHLAIACVMISRLTEWLTLMIGRLHVIFHFVLCGHSNYIFPAVGFKV